MKLHLIAMAGILALAACDREDRATRPDPLTGEAQQEIVQTSLTAGPAQPKTETTNLPAKYEGNAFQVSQGKKLYAQFNCNGCHANGGGGSGPALMDDRWIYGGNIENIVQTIREGRPNGMPSWRDRITDDQIWQIAAYVRSMSGQLSKDVAPSRNDDMQAHPSENRQPKSTPVQGGWVPSSAEAPQ